jgi:hypothetical protein
MLSPGKDLGHLYWIDIMKLSNVNKLEVGCFMSSQNDLIEIPNVFVIIPWILDQYSEQFVNCVRRC